MELYDQIRRISFIFFALVGIVHFVSGLMYINGYAIPTSGLINRVLFIPFVTAAFLYGFSNFKYRLLEYGKNIKFLDYSIIILGVIVFLVLLAIELLVVDSPCPLSSFCL